MALIIAHLQRIIPPAGYAHNVEHNSWGLGSVGVHHLSETVHRRCNPGVSIASHSRAIEIASVDRRGARPVADLHCSVENGNACSAIEIPITCYQLVGVPDQAEKDEIVRSVMELKTAEVEEGYTMDAVVSRQDLLMDVRDKLLFEPEYAGNMKEKIPPKASLRIPWTWLSGALCLLQEVGELKLVLEIGRKALQHPDVKPYVHDLLLSMALAECAIAKIGFEKNDVSPGFEALARAQCLLRSRVSLGKMTLLSQIEESLEELAPACTLEILGMPCTPENAERRRGAIAALHELLRQGLDCQTSCKVQDWPCFLSQALNRLMATEIVDLLPWDSLAVTRKNKKLLESQNQRVVIDFSCFYTVLLAHIALGFLRKQTDLISKAKTISECLIASEGIDLKFEEAFCLFLLGEGEEADAIEKLRQLELNSNSTSQHSVPEKENKDVSGTNPILEIWLKNAVLGVFPDTQDSAPSLVNFFSVEKQNLRKRQSRRAPQTMPAVSHRPLCASLASNQRDIEEPFRYRNSSLHLGAAVKPLALADLQNPLMLDKDASRGNISISAVQLKRNLGAHHNRVWESWLASRDMIGRIIVGAVLGCIVFATFNFSSMKIGWMRVSRWDSKPNMYASSLTSSMPVSSADHSLRPACIDGSSIPGQLKKLLAVVKAHLRNRFTAGNLQSSCRASSPTSSMAALYRRPMPIEEAEALVKLWQSIKAEALGPSHQIHSLSEVLDESMLVQFEALADAAKARSCFWRFVLLQLSVLRADILSDKAGAELAEIEAFLQEAAELVSESQDRNPTYYSSYKICYILRRQDDGSWKFCECDIQTP
ncbi:plastid division protein CDP1, chloroplastic isoform X2 [Malania oleifera]|uniref:plastid division protein CDP1, chloroplastic isoform X2 n=1 Tax=Malania oleifera TaxID=397392 RepID=UPI0025AE3CC7|nr:plastid division protein CDP1, chloroplastic isoform X2 [Malania oleifera]